MQEPIIIAGPPRSGSTLVAGLLKKHGVWVGKSRVTPHPETNSLISTENIDIKNLHKKYRDYQGYKNWSTPLPEAMPKNASPEKFREDVLNHVDTDGLWLIKTAWTVIYYKLWATAFPDACWVLLHRSPEAGTESAMRHPKMKKRGRQRIFSFLKAMKERQNEMYNELNYRMCLSVHYLINDCNERLMFTTLMKHCNIEPDINIANEFIEKERWHHGK